MKPYRRMSDFKINFLDHVAIRVRDMELSAAWYRKVLGLTYYQLPEWGAFPVFLLAGKTGVALFPSHEEEPRPGSAAKAGKIDHFAFNVSRADFRKAKSKFKQLGLEVREQDHHYFHSLYLEDPDGHTVELTTLVVPESAFYK